MPTATERLLGRTYRPPGYDPGDRRATAGASTRKRVAADDVDVKIEEARSRRRPPAQAHGTRLK